MCVSRGTKFGNREGHIAEKRARIVVHGCVTFLFGYAVFYGINEILRGTLDAYNREKAERNKKLGAFSVVMKVLVEICAYALGNLVNAAAAIAVTVDSRFHNLSGKNDGVYRFKHRYGQIVGLCVTATLAAEAVARQLALEYVYVTLASEQHHLFLNHRNTLELADVAGREACFSHDLDIYADVKLIKASVKGYVIDVDI